jgi:putative DNA primase/helicase
MMELDDDFEDEITVADYAARRASVAAAASGLRLMNQIDREEDEGIFPLNELGNAQRMEAEFAGKYLWTKATDWMTYSRGRWGRDNQKGVMRAMISTIEMMREVGGDGVEGWYTKSGSSKVINGSLNIASGLSTFARSYAMFDQHPELFNCANETFNLQTGMFQPHNPMDMLTKQSPVKFDPTATCPMFEKFMLEVMAGKDHLRLFLQRAGGYSISSDTSDPALFMPYGTGGTGKSQFIRVMQGVLGSYACTADSEMFVAKRGDSGQPFELAGMDGVRALFASELDEDKKLAQAKVKRMTGSDGIKACYKGKEAYEFIPQWKIWLATNDKPTVDAADDAIWDRLKLIPFDIKFRGAKSEVKDIALMLLKEESSGILNWFLKGYEMYKAEGLNYPEEVLKAVSGWRGEEDYLAGYLQERTEPTTEKNEYVVKTKLFSDFAQWAKDSKEGRWVTKKQFAEQMKRKGYNKDRVWMGFKLINAFSHYEPDISGLEDVDCDPPKKQVQ